MLVTITQSGGKRSLPKLDAEVQRRLKSSIFDVLRKYWSTEFSLESFDAKLNKDAIAINLGIKEI